MTYQKFTRVFICNKCSEQGTVRYVKEDMDWLIQCDFCGAEEAFEHDNA